MNKDLIIDFILDSFFEGGDLSVDLLADFISLDKPEQTMSIKTWAANRVTKLGTEKASLTINATKRSNYIDAEIIELNKL